MGEKDRKRGMVVKRRIGRETGVEERGIERENHREGEGETGVRHDSKGDMSGRKRKTTGMGKRDRSGRERNRD